MRQRLNTLTRCTLLMGILWSATAPAQQCPGDCNLDGSVRVDELVSAVAIAIGDASVERCHAVDRDADLNVSIAEIISAVTNALDGCPPPREVALREVPRAAHQRAAQVLEDARGTAAAPTWQSDARLGESVRLLYRPDIEGPAYYEFSVISKGEATGFVVVSSGDHDFPVPHWNHIGLPPSVELDQAATAPIRQYWKLDSLSYVGEGAGATLQAQIGEIPPRIDLGSDPSQPTASPATTVVWQPNAATDDGQVTQGGQILLDGEPAPPDPAVAPWTSLRQLKTDYAEVFGPRIASLRAQAAEEWDLEARIASDGEGLLPGDQALVPLLGPVRTVTHTGFGERYVEITTRGDSAILVDWVRDSAPDEEQTLDFTITYQDGTTQTHRFVTLNPDLVRGDASASRSTVGWAEGSTASWQTFHAGTAADQRDYRQLSPGASPNTSACASGCGATAWAMLFGWADNQAELGNPRWKSRWGIYRQGGGVSTPDAVAPEKMDAGIRSATWEIRNHIGTNCTPDFTTNGWTVPWDMSDAYSYLDGRTGAGLRTTWDGVFIATGGLLDLGIWTKAMTTILLRGDPAIIGTGYLAHYPLAWGYRSRTKVIFDAFFWKITEKQRQFYVNNGWSGSSGDGWVSNNIWFVGQLEP